MVTNNFGIKKISLWKFIPIIYIIFSYPLTLISQEVNSTTTKESLQENQKNYFIQRGEDENFLIFQTLEWTQGRHIKWYEILLEIKDEESGNWIPVNNAIPESNENGIFLPENLPQFIEEGRYKTTENKVTLSLWARESGEPQLYRYMVTSFNLLGLKSSSTDYIEFEIRKAYIPKIDSISQNLIYLDTLYDPSIRLSGSNLRKETDFYITNDKEIIRPVEILQDDNNNRAEIVFDPRDFDVGEWFLRAENPGYFTSDIPLTIKFMKWYDVSLSVGYSPLLFLYDQNINEYFGTSFMPLGADARASFIFHKRRYGYMGVSLNGKWNIVSGKWGENGIATDYIQGMISFIYRYPIIRNKLTIEARVGGGITAISGLSFQYAQSLSSEQFTSIFPAATAGLTIAGYMWRGLYVEAGVDLTSAFAPDMTILSISPTISIGWTF